MFFWQEELFNFVSYSFEKPWFFTSYSFLLTLSVFLIGYAFFSPSSRWKCAYLIVFSLFFYYKSSGPFLLLFVAVIISDFYLSRLIHKSSGLKKKLLLFFSIGYSLSFLLYFKYSNFFIGNLNLCFGTTFKQNDLFLPIGISFYTFQSISYIVDVFKKEIQKTLVRHANAINTLAEKGMYFFDYGNAFLLEASRAGAEIVKPNGDFKYNSYVQDILGPMCFDYGFGPFRWVCTSADEKDLRKTDEIALQVMEEIYKTVPEEIKQQLSDNIIWIKDAMKNNLVVGSQARILYADSEGRIKIAEAINKAIAKGEISAPVVLGRDHHDVSGTDSPYRETSNIYDGSKFTADMAVQNFVDYLAPQEILANLAKLEVEIQQGMEKLEGMLK